MGTFTNSEDPDESGVKSKKRSPDIKKNNNFENYNPTA